MRQNGWAPVCRDVTLRHSMAGKEMNRVSGNPACDRAQSGQLSGIAGLCGPTDPYPLEERHCHRRHFRRISGAVLFVVGTAVIHPLSLDRFTMQRHRLCVFERIRVVSKCDQAAAAQKEPGNSPALWRDPNRAGCLSR